MRKVFFVKIQPFVLLTAAILFLFSGCRTATDVTSYTHPLTGRRTDILGDNLLDTAEPTREMIWLNAYRDFVSQWESKHYLQVIYGANAEVGYLDISPGRSLTIVADGKEMAFNGLGSLDQKKEGNAVFESARYEVSAEDIEQIAYADNVIVRVRGRNGIVEREFGPENFQNFRKFVEQTGGGN